MRVDAQAVRLSVIRQPYQSQSSAPSLEMLLRLLSVRPHRGHERSPFARRLLAAVARRFDGLVLVVQDVPGLQARYALEIRQAIRDVDERDAACVPRSRSSDHAKPAGAPLDACSAALMTASFSMGLREHVE